MDQLNFHKQKLYALIAAGVALIALLLPWISVSFMGYSSSVNGLRGWGMLSFLGVIGVAALSLMGNRAEDYTPEFRRYAMIAFGAVALGAFLFFIRKNSVGGMMDVAGVRTGIGLWICLLAGLGGLALLYGLIKVENRKSTV
jgi:hypothetical protein